MIEKIAHLADIHIPKSPTRHEEIRGVFKDLYKKLKKEKPDLIVIVGDLFHDYIDLQPEATILAGEFLNTLALIAPVRITRGNHDIRRKSKKRLDSIDGIVRVINNPNVIYYNETDFFEDDNITWAVWKHGDKNNSPWRQKKKHVKKKGQTYIDLFHDPINEAKTPTGLEFNSVRYNTIDEFKGEFLLAGDIHKKQYFSDNKRAYCGSLFAQDFAEGDYEFHGFLLWDIKNGKVKEVEVKNNYSFKTIDINPFTDFDELDIDIDNPTKFMRFRILWKTLPETCNDNNKRKLTLYLNEKYKPILITHKPEFIEDDQLEIESDININDITEQSVQHQIFETYLNKIGLEDELIEEIINLDDEITNRLEIEELTNIEWNVVKFYAKNFMSYEDIEIDWRNYNGLFQITGLNAVGKCVHPDTEIEIEIDEKEIIKKLGFIPKELL